MESYRYEVTVYERKEGKPREAIYNQSVNNLDLLAIINIANFDNRVQQLLEEQQAEAEQIEAENLRDRWWKPEFK